MAGTTILNQAHVDAPSAGWENQATSHVILRPPVRTEKRFMVTVFPCVLTL